VDTYEVIRIAGQIPVLVVLVFGLVLLAVRGRGLAGRARVLGVVGCILLLLGAILDLVFIVGFAWFVRHTESSIRTIENLSTALEVTLDVLTAVGVGLILAAAVTGGRPSATSAPSQAYPAQGYPSPGYPAQGYPGQFNAGQFTAGQFTAGPAAPQQYPSQPAPPPVFPAPTGPPAPPATGPGAGAGPAAAPAADQPPYR
jgi:hypothetical protein